MHSVHTWTRDSREASNMDMRVLCQKGSYLYQSHNKFNLMIDDVCWQEIILNKKKWLIPACILSHWTAAVSQTVNIIIIW